MWPRNKYPQKMARTVTKDLPLSSACGILGINAHTLEKQKWSRNNLGGQNWSLPSHTERRIFYQICSLDLLQIIKALYNPVDKITYKQNIATGYRCFQSLQIFPRPKELGEENLQI